ncbi:MAG: hypothetical protein AB7N76_28790 [Planctomycetota bacterium]
MSERGRLGRIFTYLQAQFPPLVMIPSGVASFLAFHWALQALSGLEPLAVTWRAVLGALTVTGFIMLLRVYDELKDAESDRRLAAAGDPRYMDRPIVTGEVQEGDLQALRWTITAAMVAMNAPMGPFAFGVFAATYFVFWLSFKWFFWPAIQKNLLLAFATHNPLTLVVQCYVLGIFLSELKLAGPAWGVALIMVGLWFPVAAWETSRKIRLPEQETDYQTYSKMLGGWRRAACVPVVFVLGSLGCLVTLGAQLHLHVAFFGVLLLGALVSIGASLRLLLRPTPEATNLRPFVEVYAVAAQIGLAVAIGVSRGVVWGGAG